MILQDLPTALNWSWGRNRISKEFDGMLQFQHLGVIIHAARPGIDDDEEEEAGYLWANTGMQPSVFGIYDRSAGHESDGSSLE
jgi:hypothetical protein